MIDHETESHGHVLFRVTRATLPACALKPDNKTLTIVQCTNCECFFYIRNNINVIVLNCNTMIDHETESHGHVLFHVTRATLPACALKPDNKTLTIVQCTNCECFFYIRNNINVIVLNCNTMIDHETESHGHVLFHVTRATHPACALKPDNKTLTIVQCTNCECFFYIRNGCILILWVNWRPAVRSGGSRTLGASLSVWEYRSRLLGNGFKIKSVTPYCRERHAT